LGIWQEVMKNNGRKIPGKNSGDLFCAPGMVHVYTVQVRNTEGAVGVSLRQGRLPQGRV